MQRSNAELVAQFPLDGRQRIREGLRPVEVAGVELKGAWLGWAGAAPRQRKAEPLAIQRRLVWADLADNHVVG